MNVAQGLVVHAHCSFFFHLSKFAPIMQDSCGVPVPSGSFVRLFESLSISPALCADSLSFLFRVSATLWVLVKVGQAVEKQLLSLLWVLQRASQSEHLSFPQYSQYRQVHVALQLCDLLFILRVQGEGAPSRMLLTRTPPFPTSFFLHSTISCSPSDLPLRHCQLQLLAWPQDCFVTHLHAFPGQEERECMYACVYTHSAALTVTSNYYHFVAIHLSVLNPQLKNGKHSVVLLLSFIVISSSSPLPTPLLQCLTLSIHILAALQFLLI